VNPLASRTFDVVCMGEALVDFLPDTRARRVRDVVGWTRCPGGSPANVAIGLARLGAGRPTSAWSGTTSSGTS
jgi:sugar/nucleoside kinase (ribokinase family)